MMDMRGQALKTKRETQAKCDLQCSCRCSSFSIFLIFYASLIIPLSFVSFLQESCVPESHVSLQVWLELRRLRRQRAQVCLIESA